MRGAWEAWRRGVAEIQRRRQDEKEASARAANARAMASLRQWRLRLGEKMARKVGVEMEGEVGLKEEEVLGGEDEVRKVS